MSLANLQWDRTRYPSKMSCLVKIFRGRFVVNPIYHHRNLFFRGSFKPLYWSMLRTSTLWLCQIAIENCHRNSEFSHEKWWIFPQLCKRLSEGFHLFTLLQKVPDLTEKSYVFLPGSNTSVTQRISPSETGFQMVSPDPPRSRRIQHDTATGGREMLVALWKNHPTVYLSQPPFILVIRSGQMIICYNISQTWITVIWGWFPLLTMIIVRENSEVVIKFSQIRCNKL